MIIINRYGTVIIVDYSLDLEMHLTSLLRLESTSSPWQEKYLQALSGKNNIYTRSFLALRGQKDNFSKIKIPKKQSTKKINSQKHIYEKNPEKIN